MNLHDISSGLVDELKTMIYYNSGRTPLYFNVRGDNNEVLHLSMPEAKVNAREFILAGRKNADLNIRVIK